MLLLSTKINAMAILFHFIYLPMFNCLIVCLCVNSLRVARFRLRFSTFSLGCVCVLVRCRDKSVHFILHKCVWNYLFSLANVQYANTTHTYLKIWFVFLLCLDSDLKIKHWSYRIFSAIPHRHRFASLNVESSKILQFQCLTLNNIGLDMHQEAAFYSIVSFDHIKLHLFRFCFAKRLLFVSIWWRVLIGMLLNQKLSFWFIREWAVELCTVRF